MRTILIILLCFLNWSGAYAQKKVTGHETFLSELSPGVADDIFDPKKPGTPAEQLIPTWKKTIVTEIDLAIPENRMLDSLYNFYGEKATFRQMMCESVLRRKVLAYMGMNKDNPGFTAIKPKIMRQIIEESAALQVDRIVLLEEWIYFNENNYLIAKNLAIAIAYRNSEAETVPLFWTVFPEISTIFGRYKFNTTEGNKKTLSEYFERRGFEAVMPYLDKNRRYMLRRAQ